MNNNLSKNWFLDFAKIAATKSYLKKWARKITDPPRLSHDFRGNKS